MNMQRFSIDISEGLTIQAYSWLPESKPLAVLQIAHGMMEHAQRYEGFAKWMNEKQVAVYANDHIGHGLSVNTADELSHFPRKDDWQRSVDILHLITTKIRADHPGVPLFIFGHSMGSVLVQSYMIRFGNEAEGYILSGTIRQSMLMANLGLIMVRILTALHGTEYRSQFLLSLGYGQYKKYFKPVRTEFDWLSRDREIVDRYVGSPLCGMPLTTGFYKNLFDGFAHIACRANLMKSVKEKPVLIIAGKSDPAGSFGKTPQKIRNLLQKYASAQVELKIYNDCRHEILNELNRETVYSDILEWMLRDQK